MQTRSSDTIGSGDGRGEGLRGVLDGLVPVALLAVVVVLGIALTIGAQLATASQGYDVEQAVVVPVLAGAILVAAVIYTVACVRALRRVRALELGGNQARARGALLGLALTALIVLLPIALAAAIPQHPAP
jgi:hypothetical protein